MSTPDIARQTMFPEGAAPHIHFVVGMSRAGTTWMTQCLNCHPDIASFGETLFWGRGFKAPENGNDYTENEACEAIQYFTNHKIVPRGKEAGCLSGQTVDGWKGTLRHSLLADYPRDPQELFTRLCTFIAASERKRIVVEKTPHHINWIDRIVENLPDAKFIVMLREPYSFMLSYKFQGAQTSRERRELFARNYHPAKAALLWRGYMRAAERARDLLHDRVLFIAYDELTSSPGEVARRAFDFLGVDPGRASRNLPPIVNSSFSAVKKPSLTPDDYFWMNSLARREMRRNGYMRQTGDSGWWDVLLSVVTLPVWVIRTLNQMSSQVKESSFNYIWKWLRN